MSKTIKVLDITVDRGTTYHVCGVYKSVRKAKQAVKAFVDNYNNTRGENDAYFEYDPEAWIHTDADEIVFPFGPGDEYRIRQLVLNQAILVKE